MSSPLKMKNACLEALAIQRARARQKQRRHKRDWNFGVSPSCVKFRSADGAEITPTSRAFVATARTPTVSICALVDRTDKKNQDLPKSAHASAGLVRCSNLHPNIFSFFAATLLECTQKCALDRLKKTAERNKNVDKFLAPSGFRACSSAALCCSGSLLDTLVMAVPHRRKFPSPRHLFQNVLDHGGARR